MLFRNYVLTRRYDYGRSTAQSWEFIARARGDEALMDVASWKELEKKLRHKEGADHLLGGAKSTWKAYLHRTRGSRRSTKSESFGGSAWRL